MKPWHSLALRLALCIAVTWMGWSKAEAEGLVYSSLVWAMAFAKPLVEGVGHAFGFLRALAYRDLEGRQHAYRGAFIDVADDEEAGKWLLLSDVRKVVRHLPRDETLERLFGADVRMLKGEKAWRIRDEALLAYLDKTTTVESAKFRSWVERCIVRPSRKAREFNAP